MSYCRRGLDGSDVYIYPAVDYIVCDRCSLHGGSTHQERDAAGMLEHALEHRAAGHHVPDAAVERLRREAEPDRDADSPEERLGDWLSDRAKDGEG